MFGLSWWIRVKNSPPNAGDMGSTPRWGRSPAVGNDNPFQYSCLGSHMDRGAWWATVHGVAKAIDTTLQLNNNIQIFIMLLYVFKNIFKDFSGKKLMAINSLLKNFQRETASGKGLWTQALELPGFQSGLLCFLAVKTWTYYSTSLFSASL